MSSVADTHHVDTDPDSTFHFDADPNPDLYLMREDVCFFSIHYYKKIITLARSLKKVTDVAYW